MVQVSIMVFLTYLVSVCQMDITLPSISERSRYNFTNSLIQENFHNLFEQNYIKEQNAFNLLVQELQLAKQQNILIDRNKNSVGELFKRETNKDLKDRISAYLKEKKLPSNPEMSKVDLLKLITEDNEELKKQIKRLKLAKKVMVANNNLQSAYDNINNDHTTEPSPMFYMSDPDEEEEQKIDLEEDSEGEVDREFCSPVGLYQQIGPPTDLYIEMVEGGYKLFWKAPRHGAEMLRYYTAIWCKEPSEDRVGAIQTNNSFVIVRSLEERKIYKFQVLAMSTNDYEAVSQKYIYHVPSFPIKKQL